MRYLTAWMVLAHLEVLHRCGRNTHERGGRVYVVSYRYVEDEKETGGASYTISKHQHQQAAQKLHRWSCANGSWGSSEAPARHGQDPGMEDRCSCK
uniref:Secreted protein n=1 Tax=Mycena chlorophos TaxID=658473 RepID=A0ABQ0LCC6_MYCCL|nr:predicted protein [Mycena chlorophos]